MKKIFYLFTIISIVSSCAKDFLDKPPQGSYSSENFYTTEANAILATNACYEATRDAWAHGFTDMAIGDVASDDAMKGGSNPSDFFEMQLLKDFNINPSNWIVRALWERMYVGIYRCNIVLEKVPAIEMSSELKNRMLGEAHFMRAYYYSYLVKVYGGVPLVIKLLTPSEYQTPRSTVEQVYAQMEKDLRQAIAYLPDNYGDAEKGRATKGAAQSLLVKAYIFQEKWQQAEQLADSIITGGQYSLMPNFSDIFQQSGEHCRESIFEINFASIEGKNVGTQSMEVQLPRNFKRVLVGTNDTSKGEWSGWGFNCPTDNLVQEYEAGDIRLHATVMFHADSLCQYTDQTNGNSYIEVADCSQSPTLKHSKKVYVPHYERPQAFGIGSGQSGTNLRVIRYADVILWCAEAAMELGHDAKAREMLKMVRNRAGLSDYPSNPKYTDLREAVYHERRTEFAMEHHRYWDLVRWGRGNTMKNWREDRKGLLPIPQSEIDLSQGALQQNAGY